MSDWNCETKQNVIWSIESKNYISTDIFAYLVYVIIFVVTGYYPMPHFIKKSVCFFLAINVLIAGTGFSMHEHVCLVKRTKTVSLFHKVTCQPETPKAECAKADHQRCLKRSKCCLHKVVHYKIQTPSIKTGALQKVNLPISWCPLLTSGYFLPSRWEYKRVSSRYFHTPESAPPLYGKNRLIFIQSLLI
jgi:hypothetical protein